MSKFTRELISVLDEEKDNKITHENQASNAIHDHLTSGTYEDRAIALQLAKEADPGPRRLSWRSFVFFWQVMVVCQCSNDNGFDGSIMSSVNSMDTFHSYFSIDPSGSGTGVSIVFGIYTVGSVLAFFPASYLPDRFGRRWGMFLGQSMLLLGALLSANAKNNAMFLVGRLLTGFGCTTGSTTAKSYLTEITSPTNRGFWVGLLNSFFYIGQMLATGLAIPLGRRHDDWSWRGSMFLQCIPALLNAAFVLFLPESPRWLYSRGHREKALAILTNLHSRDKDPNSPLIQLELQEIEEAISLEGADKRFWDFRRLFSSRANRYRFGLCALVSIWGQLAGANMITYFLPVLLLQAGIKDSNRQRELNFVNSVTSFIGAMTGTSLVDRLGRRPLFLFSTFCCFALLTITGGLLSGSGDLNVTRANAAISFVFLFMVFFSSGWTPLQALYPSEVLAFENRAKGLALQGIVTNLVNLINTFALPIALKRIRNNTYFIFAGWDVVGLVVIWFVVVETKQLTLEELDEVFEAPNPKKRSFEIARAAKARSRQSRNASA